MLLVYTLPVTGTEGLTGGHEDTKARRRKEMGTTENTEGTEKKSSWTPYLWALVAPIGRGDLACAIEAGQRVRKRIVTRRR
jgi:hypothetical protein